MSFLRTRAFWVMVFRYLIIPVFFGCLAAGFVIILIIMIAGLTS